MHQWAALQTGEHRAVDGFFVLGFHENDAPARAAQTFVRGGGDHIGVRHRVGVDACRNQTRVMRHVHQKNRAYLFGHFGKAGEVYVQAVSRCACNDQLRTGSQCFGFHGVVIDFFFGVQAVALHLEPLAR